MSLVDTLARLIGQYGKTMVLAREGEGTTVTLQGARLGGSVELLGNSSVQQGFRVRIGVAELAASSWSTKQPARADMLTVDGAVRTVMDCRPLAVGEEVAGYELEVAG